MEKANTKDKQNKAKSFFLKIGKLAERILVGNSAEEKAKLTAKERIYVSNNPVSNEQQYAQYIYAIDQKIDEEDIKNIGIVAPYGAGKSSIVKTYFDAHPDKKKKSKTISLASFSFKGSDKDEPRKLKDGEQNRIEKSILEQIVYKRRFCPFSRSNLSRLHDKVLFSIIFSVVIVGSIVSIILSILAFKKVLPGLNGNTPYLCMGIASIFVLVFIFLSQHALKIRKIAIQNIEIEFESNSNVSPLNKFIDEMINFCFETKIKYFIFEDIDRFNSPELLLKLREINFLINDSDYIKEPIVFIYCVKDTVFNCAEDKYKFFDFVLSPIPIFNNDIAAEEIENRIKTNKESDIDLNPVSLKEMTRYISEMRVLNGIFNDYLIYKDELNIKREENEKLFAMMIYKNQSFSDFNKLQKNQGLLYRVFHEYKENALRVLDNKLSEQINAKKEELENKTSANAVQERFSKLKTKVRNLIDEKGRLSSTKPVDYVDNEKVGTYLNVADGLFIEINNRHPYYGSATTSYKSLSLKEIADYLGKDIADIEQDENNTIKANIQNEIHELEQTLINSRDMSAADLFLKDYYTAEQKDEIKKNDFLYMALRNRYIDESYFKYCSRKMSNFDETYIDLVINMDEIDPALVIQNPHLVISKLSDFRFKTPGILNYSLVDFILEHKQDFPDKEDSLIRYLLFREEKTIEFLCNYFCNGKRVDLLLEELKKKSYNLLVSDVLKHDGDGSSAIENIIKVLISIQNGPDLIGFYNQNNVITEFLLADKNIIERYFQLFPDSNKFINFLYQFQIKNIKHIDDMTIIKNEKMIECFNAIFINNLMEINPYNLRVISKCYFKKDVIESSDFINSEIEKVKSYYLTNIEKTITAVIESGLEIADDQTTIDFILRNNAISIDVRKIYSHHLKKNTIENIIDLDDALYLVIVEGELYRYNYNNLSYLYEKKKIDIDRLVHFVLDNFDEIKGNIENKNMLIALINHKEFPVNRVLKVAEISDQTIDLSEINDDEKMSILIRSNKLIIDENNFILCKGKRLSLFACLQKNPNLSSKLSSFYSTNEYEDLFLDKSLSAKVKACVANENFNIFKASISKKSVEQILIAVKRYKNKNYSKDFLLWLITLGTEDDRNYLLKTYSKTLEMN